MPERATFYVTTAIPYANGAPHIGHAYERIATDAFARFNRLDGRDTLFVTGMDEHGLKMQQTAARENLTPLALADRTAAQFEAMGEKLNARADDVIRTTQARHKAASQEIWRRMAARGDIYLSKYSGWYSVRDEAYYDADELTENSDGKKFAPTGTPVEWVEEESYFFRLSAYQDKLLAHYEAQPDFITPEKYKNEIVAFVKRGLKDLSVSRTTFDWGVPVPGDDRHVMYVWVDALTNYLTGTGFPEPGERGKFWPADAHVIGKDITRFHAVYLAGLSDVGRYCAAETDRRAWISVQSRRENVEVGRQCDRPFHAGRPLWRRCAALFLPARSALRAGRQLFARGHRAAHQRRSRQ